MNKRNMKISIILNVIIPIMIVFSCIMMFTGFKIFNGPEPVLESTGFSIFRFFTVDSNLFMAIVAGIFAYYEYKLLIGTIKKIPRFVNILKLMSTVGVALTFIVVFVYLGPIAKDGLLSLLRNSNLFLHLLMLPYTLYKALMLHTFHNLLVSKHLYFYLLFVLQ